MTSNNLKAVIFDFDGVIVDSFETIFHAYNEACSNLNLPLFNTLQEFKRFYTVDFWKNYDHLGLKTDNERNKFYKTIQEFINDKYHLAPFFKDMLNVITMLKSNKKLKIGIASTGEAKVIKQKIQDTCLDKVVDVIVGFEMVKNIKPHPEPILLCCNLLNIDPMHSIYVGDTSIDVKAGKAAKVKKTIAVTWGYEDTDKIRKEIPDIILNSAYELLLFI